MLKHYIRIASRSLQKNKGYAFLNILGLATGIACAGLIFLWVEDEVTFDSNQANRDRVYVVKVNDQEDKGVFTHTSTPGPLAPVMATMPGVEATCRTTEGTDAVMFRVGDRSMNASGKYVEPSYFSLFTLPFVEGGVFTQRHSIVITESAAKKFFGSVQHIVGRTVNMDNKQDYVVSGVIRDFPANTSLPFEWAVPFDVFFRDNEHFHKWNNFGITTYVELKPGVDPGVLNRQLLEPRYDFTTQKVESEVSTVHLFLFGMKDWRLRDQFDNGKPTGSGRITYVHLFSLIAWIVLLIACINFMNLATARSEKRSKEVGVRKVLGAGKPGLVGQFMGEALVLSLAATLVAVLLMALVLPAFNLLVQKNLTLDLWKPLHLGALFLLALVCGLVAGSYPSLYLSSFNPVFVLKGIRLKTGSAALIRKGLVVLQFTVSIVLIIATVIIYQQIQHVKNRNLGFNRKDLVQIPLQGNLLPSFTALRQELIDAGIAKNAALTDHVTLEAGNNTGGIGWVGKPPASNVIISVRLTSPEFMSTLGMHIREGRDFEATDTMHFMDPAHIKDFPVIHVLVTRSMEQLMGGGSAVGKTLTQDGNLHVDMVVAGVVDDYMYGDMYGHPDPVVFWCIPQFTTYMYVRLRPGIAPDVAIAKMTALCKKYNPGYPFDYLFVEDQFNDKFMSEMLISKLSRVFAALAILISCLGLFGLAAYTAEQRVKEIGIRKVLGATGAQIAELLSRDFIRLVLLSCLIAFPVSGWIMHNWLQGFAYRIGIQWWVFAVAGAASILIALGTVSFQAIKAAAATPVKSLRAE
ncbi:ABC transporter permease [Dinghuibacter silviterrae]|uniref:Putative permease n=1 Tax=Dinghuibacter silviterrae TaxID=1539049 RepID=A0A4R8DG08_9BACT|nr:ABC transporter permease [Dinghuibacter silviterrae]TDW96549.1 putative permease [Dinghuibacter silviterrae]